VVVRIFLLLGVVVFSGCTAMLADGFREDLEKKASFELNCPKDQLEMTPLKKIWAGRVTQMGVRGCGQQATYIHTENYEWVRDQ
jgi:hypothetical protein